MKRFAGFEINNGGKMSLRHLKSWVTQDYLAAMKCNIKNGGRKVKHFRKLFKRFRNQADPAFEIRNLFLQTIRWVFARKFVLGDLVLHI